MIVFRTMNTKPINKYVWSYAMGKRKLLLLSLLMLILLSGCASTAQETGIFVWPSPPDEPRIAYVRSYTGAGDFRKSSFLDAIFGKPASARLAKPYGVFAQGDKIYAALTAGRSVAVIDEKARTVSYVGDRGAGRLALPIGVARAADGTLFVSDAKQKRIFGYNAEGKLVRALGKKGEFKNPSGIAINNTLGRLYVVDSFGHTVHVYSLAGKPLFRFGSRGVADGSFNYPSNVAIDRRNGKVFVMDTQNFRVQIFDQDGKFLTKFGGVGDRPGNFSRPKGIGIDSDGNVYVADAAFDNFQIFDENGELLLFIGSAGAGPGQFQLPAGLFVDERDRIFVVDSLNSRVQVFQYFSERWKSEHPDEYKKYLLEETRGR